MEVSKGQLVSGLTRFGRNEVLNKITDKPFKMALAAGINLLELRPDVADKLLENPLFKASSGMYDLDLMEAVISKTMDEYGDLPVMIPGIPLLSPTPKELRFTAEDVHKLKGYILG